MVLSEHRLYYLTGFADEYWIMEKGEIVKRYTAEEFSSLSPQELSALYLRNTDLGSVTLQTRANVQESENGNFTFGVSDIHFGYQRKTGDVLILISY